MNQKISNVEEKVKELTVLLLYLTSWDEKIIGKTIKMVLCQDLVQVKMR